MDIAQASDLNLPPYQLYKVIGCNDRRWYNMESLYVARGSLGLGLFAGLRISSGDIIHQFSGKAISFCEALEKGSRQCWPLQVRNKVHSDAYIDLDFDAPGCFANHSCSPNAGIVEDTVLIALRDIQVSEEIRFDYSTTMDEDCFEMNCNCGALFCRRRVRDFKHLPEESRARYLSLGTVSSFIACQFEETLPRKSGVSSHLLEPSSTGEATIREPLFSLKATSSATD